MIRSALLETPRLWLRPVERSDASAIQMAAAVREIADTMISIPHPYPDGEAARYIARQQAEFNAGRAVAFAIELKKMNGFGGVIEVREIDREHLQAELSFWLKPDHWGQGFMSEAVQAVVPFGFEVLDLNRLYAHHMLRNPASGRILEKSGFTQEGLLRERVVKWGQFEDVALWAMLSKDWRETRITGD